MAVLKVKRGTRVQIDTAATALGLVQGEPYLITDEGRFAVGLTNATYSSFVKQGEQQPLDADLTAIAALAGTSGFLKKTAADTWTLDTASYLTGNQSISLTGDITGSGTTAITTILKDTGTAGTYTKITTDAQGRVTAGTTLAATDIPTLTAAKISDFASTVTATTLNSFAAPTADLALNNKKITGLAEPTAATDAATKNYVDLAIQGLDPKGSVKAATTANITLSGAQTIDTISVIAGDRVLVKDQSTQAQNGIYLVAAGAWTRTSDANTWSALVGGYVFAEQGATNADVGFLCTVDATGTLGSTSVTFTQFTGAGNIVAGTGMTKTGSTLDVVGTLDRITANADSIDIASTYVGQSSITTLGTIATGTWSATAIAPDKGGTGLTAAITGLLKGNGTSYTTAVAGTDYLTPTSTIDGGTF